MRATKIVRKRRPAGAQLGQLGAPLRDDLVLVGGAEWFASCHGSGVAHVGDRLGSEIRPRQIGQHALRRRPVASAAARWPSARRNGTAREIPRLSGTQFALHVGIDDARCQRNDARGIGQHALHRARRRASSGRLPPWRRNTRPSRRSGRLPAPEEMLSTRLSIAQSARRAQERGGQQHRCLEVDAQHRGELLRVAAVDRADGSEQSGVVDQRRRTEACRGMLVQPRLESRGGADIVADVDRPLFERCAGRACRVLQRRRRDGATASAAGVPAVSSCSAMAAPSPREAPVRITEPFCRHDGMEGTGDRPCRGRQSSRGSRRGSGRTCACRAR